MTQQIQPPQVPQLSPEEGNREMTPAEVRQLQEIIQNVRKVIARFHDTRRRNNERMAGLRAAVVYPQQVQQLAQQTREPQIEQQAVETLRQFLRVLRGHEPTRQEMQEGIPAGIEDQMAMGGIPFAVGAVAIALGTSVFSVFNYLGNHEEMIATQTATPLERGLRALSDNIWGVAAVGAVVGGVYIYHRTQNAGERRHEREMEKIREMGRAAKSVKANPSHKPEPDEDGDEQESFIGNVIEKAKGLVKNGLFPPEKNPSYSPAKKLASQYETLSEDEQERFVAMMNGEEVEDEPEEEPEEVEEEIEEEEVEENPGNPADDLLEEGEEEQDEEESDD